MEELLYSLGEAAFINMSRRSVAESLLRVGVSQRFIDDVVSAVLRASYGQSAAMPAFAGEPPAPGLPPSFRSPCDNPPSTGLSAAARAAHHNPDSGLRPPVSELAADGESELQAHVQGALATLAGVGLRPLGPWLTTY